ncbi:hypothetical protein LTR17_019847 [Elasticomyces elasticus]|nr:hypothetical protein LTR17_019847 [Elasticomyces elasticus]
MSRFTEVPSSQSPTSTKFSTQRTMDTVTTEGSLLKRKTTVPDSYDTKSEAEDVERKAPPRSSLKRKTTVPDSTDTESEAEDIEQGPSVKQMKRAVSPQKPMDGSEDKAEAEDEDTIIAYAMPPPQTQPRKLKRVAMVQNSQMDDSDLGLELEPLGNTVGVDESVEVDEQRDDREVGLVETTETALDPDSPMIPKNMAMEQTNDKVTLNDVAKPAAKLAKPSASCETSATVWDDARSQQKLGIGDESQRECRAEELDDEATSDSSADLIHANTQAGG